MSSRNRSRAVDPKTKLGEGVARYLNRLYARQYAEPANIGECAEYDPDSHSIMIKASVSKASQKHFISRLKGTGGDIVSVDRMLNDLGLPYRSVESYENYDVETQPHKQRYCIPVDEFMEVFVADKLKKRMENLTDNGALDDVGPSQRTKFEDTERQKIAELATRKFLRLAVAQVQL